MPGCFIALEGIDGCGKTTLAQSVAAIPPTEGFADGVSRERLCFRSRRTVPEGSGFAANLMRQNAQMLWHSGDATDLSPHYWVTLQSSWYTAMTDVLLNPALEAGDNIVLDGWMYKFWSKLLNQGYTEAELHTLFRGARVPDHVVLLDIDVASVYDRGRDFRPTELGMHVGYGELSRATFIDYQTRGMVNLRRLASEYGWSTLTIPADEPVELTARRLADLIHSVALAGVPT